MKEIGDLKFWSVRKVDDLTGRCRQMIAKTDRGKEWQNFLGNIHHSIKKLNKPPPTPIPDLNINFFRVDFFVETNGNY